jgi:hypothetical protein
MALANGSLVSSIETCASSSSNSTSITRKTASGNSCKNLRAIQRSDQELWPFEPVLWSAATRPPTHRVAIPHLLLLKRLPETPVKI